MLTDLDEAAPAGFGGHPIRARLRLPRRRAGRLPGVVQFHFDGTGLARRSEDPALAPSAFRTPLLPDPRPLEES